MNSHTREALTAEINALLERRRTTAAKMRLKDALQQFPDDQELQLQAAWADYIDDDNAAAETTVKQLLAKDPTNESARQLLFHLLLEKNALAEAEEIIIGLLREYPRYAPYYGQYALALVRATQTKKARTLANEGLKFDPDDINCLSAQTFCDFIEQKSGVSSQALQKLLQRHPQSIRTLALIMAALEDRGDHRAAYRISQELVRAQPDNPDIIQAALDLKVANHWSLYPLWPLLRWGWAGSIGLWILAVTSIYFVGHTYPNYAFPVAIGYIAYVVYSWVWPPVLRRWISQS